jgi:hypothetical protein
MNVEFLANYLQAGLELNLKYRLQGEFILKIFSQGGKRK